MQEIERQHVIELINEDLELLNKRRRLLLDQSKLKKSIVYSEDFLSVMDTLIELRNVVASSNVKDNEDEIKKIVSNFFFNTKRNTSNEGIEKLINYEISLMEIENTLGSIKLGVSEDRLKRLNFIWVFDTKVSPYKASECNHPIYLFRSCNHVLPDIRGEHDTYYHVPSEDEINYDTHYLNNSYRCLHCGQIITTEDYVEFERTHTVLRKENECLKDEEYYNNFLDLLYYHEIEEAEEIIKSKFSSKKEKKIFTYQV